jgi:hypothetical protein
MLTFTTVLKLRHAVLPTSDPLEGNSLLFARSRWGYLGLPLASRLDFP